MISHAVLATVQLINLHAPDGSDVLINIDEVVSMRGPKSDDSGKLFANDVHCLINTSDGKYVSVRESCKDVMRIFVDTERAP